MTLAIILFAGALVLIASERLDRTKCAALVLLTGVKEEYMAIIRSAAW